MFQKLSIRLKLILLSGLAVSALLAAILIGTLGIRSGIDGVEVIGRSHLPAVLALQRIKEAQTALKSSTFETGLWENHTDAQHQFAQIAKDKKLIWSKIPASWQAFEAIPKSAEEMALWNKFVVEWETWKAYDEKIIATIQALAENKDAAMQKSLYQKYFALGAQQRPSYLATEALLDQVMESKGRNVEIETHRAEQETRMAQRIITVVGASAVIALLALALIITRSIVRQLGGELSDAVAITRQMAQGDFTVNVPLRSDDRHSLLAALDNMRQNLRELVLQIHDSSGLLTASAKSLIDDVARVERNGEAENHAAELTANSVQLIAGQVEQIGSSAETARNLSEQASRYSQEGRAVIETAANAMSNISSTVSESSELIEQLGSYSEQISAIVDVIKDITKQTTLLALNASIEAARVGEQGRGFMVVAEEVGKLSSRTIESTQEITSMILNIQHRVTAAVDSMQSAKSSVEQGASLAVSATKAMVDIHAGADNTSNAVINIASQLQESSRNLAEIESSVGNIVTKVAHNMDSVRTMANSAHSVEDLAARFVQSIHRFKV